jgi:hypothetical protein
VEIVSNSDNNNTNLVAALLTILAISVVQIVYTQALSTKRYTFGYNDGCAGTVVPGSNDVLNADILM